MENVVKKVAAALTKCAGKRIAVGVSGGRDSMCLLHAVLCCDGIKKEDVLAVHVNHCLRKTAARDEEFVRAQCERLGVELCTFSVDVKKLCADRGLTVEQAARELRYEVFYDLIKTCRADVILTAHHALDNAESVLMHMFRGSGLDGLRAMNGGEALLRPLLDVYPDELDEFAAIRGIDYVVDETNLIPDVDRNFLRLKIMPLIEERYPGAVRAINALSHECAGVCDILEGELDGTYIRRDRGAVVVDERALCTPLAERYIRRALTYFTLTDVTREQIQNVVELVSSALGKTAELSCGVKAMREDGGVALFIPRPIFSGELPLKKGANFIDGLAVDVESAGGIAPCGVRGGVVDISALDGSVLRFRRDGDIFEPFGGGTKKLKQYFTDNKIPRRCRDRIPLICRGNEVLVIVGVQISQKVRITPSTQPKDKYVVKCRY